MAGKELNAPRAISFELRAGQLERRILDGVAFIEAAGFAMEAETTNKGHNRFTFRQQFTPTATAIEGGDAGFLSGGMDTAGAPDWQDGRD
jgi:hypothetical protein